MDEHVVEGRLDLVDARIEHAFERIETLEEGLRSHTQETQSEEERDAEEARHEDGRRMNLAMLWLFVAEVALGIFEVWWMVRHA